MPLWIIIVIGIGTIGGIFKFGKNEKIFIKFFYFDVAVLVFLFFANFILIRK
jgi:hypothetical protein